MKKLVGILYDSWEQCCLGPRGIRKFPNFSKRKTEGIFGGSPSSSHKIAAPQGLNIIREKELSFFFKFWKVKMEEVFDGSSHQIITP